MFRVNISFRHAGSVLRKDNMGIISDRIRMTAVERIGAHRLVRGLGLKKILPCPKFQATLEENFAMSASTRLYY